MFWLNTLLVALVSSFLLAEPAVGTEVLYVQQNNSILTYDVDPNSLQAELVGSPLDLSGAPQYFQVVPSRNGHVLYILSSEQPGSVRISVYATDAAGVPRKPAVQTMSPAAISQFVIDPHNRFAYAVKYHRDSSGNYIYTIRLFTIDGVTGTLSESPVVLEKYPPNFYCVPGLIRFSSNGNTVYEAVSCNYPDTSTTTLYERTVDEKTGQLGPELQFFSFNGSTTFADEVRLSNRTINDLHVDYTGSSVLVYPLVNPKSPRIHCTSAMLTVCGNAGAFWQDTSGMFLLLEGSSTFDVTKVDFAENKIVETGSTFSDLQQPYFSPDDRLMFGVTYNFNNPSTVQIYGFDSANGMLTQGARISIPGIVWDVFPARRF